MKIRVKTNVKLQADFDFLNLARRTRSSSSYVKIGQ